MEAADRRRAERRRGRPSMRAAALGGPTIVTAGGERGGDARAAALPGADGARLRRCCWWSGVAIALPLRADRRLGGVLAGRRPTRRRARRARWRSDAAAWRAAWRGGRASCCAITRSSRRGRTSGAGRGRAPSRARARRRPGAGGARLGLDTQTHVRDRHDQAGAAEPRARCGTWTRSSAPPAWAARST